MTSPSVMFDANEREKTSDDDVSGDDDMVGDDDMSGDDEKTTSDDDKKRKCTTIAAVVFDK